MSNDGSSMGRTRPIDVYFYWDRVAGFFSVSYYIDFSMGLGGTIYDFRDTRALSSSMPVRNVV